MRKILPLLLTLLFAIPVFASHSFVQGPTGVECSGTTTCTITLSSTQTAGNANIIYYKYSDNASFVSLTNNNSNAVAACTAEVDDTNINIKSAIYYSKNIASGSSVSYTLTLNIAPTDDIRIWTQEWSGLSTTSPCDQSNSNQSVTAVTGADDMTSGNITPTQANELVVGLALPNIGPAVAGTGFTSRSTAGGNLIEDKTISSTSTTNATATDQDATGGDIYFFLVASFMDAAVVTPHKDMAIII